MEHQVRVDDLVVAAREATGLEVVAGTGPATEDEPLEADPRPPPELQRRLHRDRLRAGVLDVDLEMVLQVLAHAGQVGHHGHAQRLELGRGADARELQELRRVDGATAQDDRASSDLTGWPGALVVDDADGTPALEGDATHEGARLDLEVRPVRDGMQVGSRGRQATTTADVAVERGEALLPLPVDVWCERVAGLLDGLEEGAEEGVGGRPALQPKRPAVSPVGVVLGRRQAVFRAPEVGQAVRVVPVGHARVGGPALEVELVATLEDHAVDAA